MYRPQEMMRIAESSMSHLKQTDMREDLKTFRTLFDGDYKLVR